MYILISAGGFLIDKDDLLPVEDHPAPQIRAPSPYDFDDMFDSSLVPKDFPHTWVNGKSFSLYYFLQPTLITERNIMNLPHDFKH